MQSMARILAMTIILTMTIIISMPILLPYQLLLAIGIGMWNGLRERITTGGMDEY